MPSPTDSSRQREGLASVLLAIFSSLRDELECERVLEPEVQFYTERGTRLASRPARRRAGRHRRVSQLKPLSPKLGDSTFGPGIRRVKHGWRRKIFRDLLGMCDKVGERGIEPYWQLGLVQHNQTNRTASELWSKPLDLLPFSFERSSVHAPRSRFRTFEADMLRDSLSSLASKPKPDQRVPGRMTTAHPKVRRPRDSPK